MEPYGNPHGPTVSIMLGGKKPSSSKYGEGGDADEYAEMGAEAGAELAEAIKDGDGARVYEAFKQVLEVCMMQKE